MRKVPPGIALMVVMLLLGCASADPMPQSPTYKTSEGRTCATDCQRRYVDCVRVWKYAGSFSSVPTARVNECRLMLGECYEFCLEEDKPSSP